MWGVAMRPVIVRDEDSLIAMLRGRRELLGFGQRELDDAIGWSDGYVAKTEAPERKFGRRVAWGLSRYLFWWLEALKLRLVLVDVATAETLAAGDGDEASLSEHRPKPRPAARCGVIRQETVSVTYAFNG